MIWQHPDGEYHQSNEPHAMTICFRMCYQMKHAAEAGDPKCPVCFPTKPANSGAGGGK